MRTMLFIIVVWVTVYSSIKASVSYMVDIMKDTTKVHYVSDRFNSTVFRYMVIDSMNPPECDSIKKGR